MSNFVRCAATLLTALIALGAVTGGASAEDMLYALKIGALAHDVPDLWSGFQVEKNAVDINIEAQFNAAWVLPWGAIRPVIGGSINTRGDTSDGYIDARWQGDCPSGLFFGIGLGGAIHDGEIGGPGSDPDKKWLGSRVLFHIPMEVGYHLDEHNDISVYFEHMSNAYTQKYNEGMDRVGLRYGYRF
ncbi:MAG: acyloxyacyl hydrolase [Hyphomicrobium sp.]